ncbi:MAG: caspase family protein, partial [Bacteroidetes bacterium]|nr:caspase family protein [Bacteroidota bacterium]
MVLFLFLQSNCATNSQTGQSEGPQTDPDTFDTSVNNDLDEGDPDKVDDPEPYTPVKYALLVGINDYEAVNDLEGCINDVENMKALLRGKFDFQEENILILTDKQATKEGVITAFKTHLIDQAQHGDIVLFHYSGHGSQMY